MENQTSLTFVLWLRSLAQKSSIIVMLIGLLGILGWIFNIPLFTTILPRLEPIRINAAFCLILSGVALWLNHWLLSLSHSPLKKKVQWMICSLALLIFSMAFLTLIEHLFKINLSIDQWLISHPNLFSTDTFSNRIPLNASLALLSVSLTFLLMNFRPQWLGISQLMAILVWLHSFFAIIGNLYNTVGLLTIHSWVGMSVNTAIALQFLSLGILCLYPDHAIMTLLTSQAAGSIMARRLLPIIIVLPPLINGICQLGVQWQFYTDEIQIALTSSLDLILLLILVGWNAHQMNLSDYRRTTAEQVLHQTNLKLEQRITERTFALEQIKTQLEERVIQRTKQLQFINNRLQQELIQGQKNEQILQQQAQLLDLAHDSIVTLNLDGVITFWNQGAANLYGWSKQEAIGQVIYDLLKTQFPQPFTEIKAALLGSEFWEGELTQFKRDGTLVISTTRWVLRRDSDGQPSGILEINNDITARKVAEESAQASQSFLVNILNGSTDLFAALDLNFKFIAFNRSYQSEFLRLFGEDIEIGTSLIEALKNFPETQSKFVKIWQRSLQGEKFTWVEEVNDSYGERSYYENQSGQLRDRKGQLIGAFNIIRDTTERKQAEKELALQSVILKNMAEGVCLLRESDKIIVYTNPKFDRIFGYDVGELIGKPVKILNYETQQYDAEAIVRHVSEQLTQQGEASYEVHNVKKDGTPFWCRAQASLFEHPDYGTVLVCVQEDITEQKKAEQNLRETQEQFQAFMDYSPVLAWITDSSGDLQFANCAFQNLLNKPVEQLIGKNIFELFPEPIAATQKVNNDYVASTQQDYQGIELAPRLDGNLGSFLVYKFPIRSTSGNLLIGGVAIDITEQKQAQEALKLSEERLQLALEASDDGLWDWNIERGEAYFSPRYFEMLGYQFEEFVPNFENWQQLIHPEDKPWVLNQLYAHWQDHAVKYAFDYRLKTKSGEWKWIANYGKVFRRNAQGEPLRMTGTHKDISDRKQIELDLQHAKEAAEAANQAKSIFLANMSHELRTPLNVILGFTQIMNRDTSMPIEHQETIQIIHRSGEHLLNLINDILDLSKIEAGRITLEENDFDLFALLVSLQDMLRYRAESKGLQFHFDIGLEVPQFIHADEKKLRQILINLLTNAIKFTEQGRVTLGVQTAPISPADFSPPTNSQDAQDTNVILIFAVEDTGIGIAPDEIDTIFDAFSQSNSGKIAPGGTGLGLTITRRFVQLMGGKISVHSTLGQGSEFSVSMPIQMAQSPQIPPPEPQCQVIGLAPGQPIYRLLVVDDQPENRLLLTRLMKQLGLEVYEASNGAEALQLWQQWEPQLIWMDLRMPVMDGYQATQQIRATPNGISTIIIALTAHASLSDRALAIAAGCNDFVSKPFRENLLYEKMAHHLGLRFLYAETPQTFSDPLLSTPQPTEEPLTPIRLSIMPDHWIAALYRASQLCDEDEIEQLIAQIPPTYSSLANQLTHLTHNYQFDQIQRLAKPNADAQNE